MWPRSSHRSYLVAVDTDTGEAAVLRQHDGPPPPAGWDQTGRYVAMVEGNDLTVLDTADGNEFTLTGVIPIDHHVTSMR